MIQLVFLVALLTLSGFCYRNRRQQGDKSLLSISIGTGSISALIIAQLIYQQGFSAFFEIIPAGGVALIAVSLTASVWR